MTISPTLVTTVDAEIEAWTRVRSFFQLASVNIASTAMTFPPAKADLHLIGGVTLISPVESEMDVTIVMKTVLSDPGTLTSIGFRLTRPGFPADFFPVRISNEDPLANNKLATIISYQGSGVSGKQVTLTGINRAHALHFQRYDGTGGSNNVFNISIPDGDTGNIFRRDGNGGAASDLNLDAPAAGTNQVLTINNTFSNLNANGVSYRIWAEGTESSPSEEETQSPNDEIHFSGVQTAGETWTYDFLAAGTLSTSTASANSVILIAQLR